MQPEEARAKEILDAYIQSKWEEYKRVCLIYGSARITPDLEIVPGCDPADIYHVKVTHA